ncbi:hypothetical protein [Arboricoccus pini]|uniref:hypothetical protein n=1 Tax=Arboricoccus pini TaxID=1963835 RepID=UPI0013FD5F4C
MRYVPSFLKAVRPAEEFTGRLEGTNDAAEPAIRPLAPGRKNNRFADGEQAAANYTSIETAHVNGIDVEAVAADLISGLASHPTGFGALALAIAWNSRCCLSE